MSDKIFFKTPTQVGKIGRVLLGSGKLTESQADDIILLQQKKKIRFGEAAIELGYVTQSDIDYALGYQFDYCYLSPGDGLVSEAIHAAYSPYTEYMENIRSLRSYLNLTWINKGNKSILFSCFDNKGTSSELVANLAVSFSQLGKKTLLVDANLRHSRQHVFFNIENNIGLTDILAGRSDIEHIKTIECINNFFVLTSGTPTKNPQELLSRPQFKFLQDELEQYFDVVIYDSSALGLYADAQVIAGSVQGTIIIAFKNKTKSKDLNEIVNRLKDSNAKILGCVLNEDFKIK